MSGGVSALVGWTCLVSLALGGGMGAFVGWWAATGRAERKAQEAGDDLYFDGVRDGRRAEAQERSSKVRTIVRATEYDSTFVAAGDVS